MEPQQPHVLQEHHSFRRVVWQDHPANILQARSLDGYRWVPVVVITPTSHVQTQIAAPCTPYGAAANSYCQDATGAGMVPPPPGLAGASFLNMSAESAFPDQLPLSSYQGSGKPKMAVGSREWECWTTVPNDACALPISHQGAMWGKSNAQHIERLPWEVQKQQYHQMQWQEPHTTAPVSHGPVVHPSLLFEYESLLVPPGPALPAPTSTPAPPSSQAGVMHEFPGGAKRQRVSLDDGAPTVTLADIRQMATFIVDTCIHEGKLPVFGRQGRQWILDFQHHGKLSLRAGVGVLVGPSTHSPARAADAWMQDSLERWCRNLAHPAWASIRLTTERGLSTVFSNYLNRKISERWNCRGKALVKGLPPRIREHDCLQPSDWHCPDLLQSAAKWVRVSCATLNLDQLALFVWRTNKALGGDGLKGDVQQARKKIKGMKRSEAGATEFGIARDKWIAEIAAVKRMLHEPDPPGPIAQPDARLEHHRREHDSGLLSPPFAVELPPSTPGTQLEDVVHPAPAGQQDLLAECATHLQEDRDWWDGETLAAWTANASFLPGLQGASPAPL